MYVEWVGATAGHIAETVQNTWDKLVQVLHSFLYSFILLSLFGSVAELPLFFYAAPEVQDPEADSGSDQKNGPGSEAALKIAAPAPQHCNI